MPHPPTSARALVIRILGFILILAALGKWLSPPSLTSASLAWRSDPVVFGLIVEAEFLVGLWCLSGLWLDIAWLVLLPIFHVLAFVSGRLWLVGEVSCGCAGSYKLNPVYPFVLDGVAIIALWLVRPRVSSTLLLASVGSQVRRGILPATLLVGVLVATLFAALAIFGSARAAVAWLRNESLAITPSVVDFGEGSEGDRLEAPLEVRNYSTGPIRVVGATIDCNCAILEGVPQTIPQGGIASFVVKFKVVGQAGRQVRDMELWTDAPDRPTVRVPLTCRVNAR